MTRRKLLLGVIGRQGQYPAKTNSDSVATMRITPIVIVAMTAISLTLGFSNLNKNAKTNTNANVEDLHNADISHLYKWGAL
jgi:hypothetical protein